MAYILKDGKISKEKLHISQDKIKQLLLTKKDELHNQYGVTTLGLYGSYARDEATKDSDIDIFRIAEYLR